MQRISIAEIAAAIGATGPMVEALGADFTGPGGDVSYISTDSRDLPEGSLFVALEGERVDGHRFIPMALRSGAAFAVAHREVEGLGPLAERVLYVRDTFPVLMQIAAAYRRRFSPIMVAVTGSVGKTTTKEFIAAVLAKRYRTLKSQGNQNNEIGLPKTLFRLDDSHQAAVLEMGMAALGDISLLTKIVEPQVGVITNIGLSHIEHLGSRENILQAKLEIREGMADGSTLLLNGDDDLLCQVEDSRLRLLFYGIENENAPLRATDVVQGAGETTFTLHWQGERYPATLPTLGRHNVYNALAAFGVGVSLGIEPREILEALGDYAPAGMRQRMVQHGGYTVVEDCYNASPDSMAAALATLAQYPAKGRKICVFADMLELGEVSERSHLEVGALAARQGADLLLCTGEAAKGYLQGAQAAGLPARHFATKDALAQALMAEAAPGDLVWVKGSRGMALEEVLEKLYQG